MSSPLSPRNSGLPAALGVDPGWLALAQRPTPLTAAPLLLPGVGVERGPRLFLKRDDMTGVELSGNKVRKLELLLADAERRGADTVLTCGGVQSNHCRATAFAATQRGLRSVLFLRTADPASPPAPAVGGNLLLSTMAGAEVRFISPANYRRRAEVMAAAAAELAARGARPYVIPEGGSNAIGSLGYTTCVTEIAAQLEGMGEDPRAPLTLCHATGSGGTGAGLLLGVAALGLPWRVVSVNVCDDAAYFERVTAAILDEAAGLGVEPAVVARARGLLEMADGYVGRGYALSRPEELDLLARVARVGGFLLDPVYTGKAFFGMVDRLRADPRSFGERLVFVHTGGVFGLLTAPVAGELAAVLGGARS